MNRTVGQCKKEKVKNKQEEKEKRKKGTHGYRA
jgi:hypothetical protein